MAKNTMVEKDPNPESFWQGVKTKDGTKLTNAKKIEFLKELVKALHKSAELAKIQFNTQVYNKIENGVTTRGEHTEGVALVAGKLAVQQAKNQGKSPEEQEIAGLLAEALGLMHDLGHTPFGHDGESALNAEMQRFAADADYLDKRKTLYGSNYTSKENDQTVTTMCYEHNETSSIIGSRFLEDFAKEHNLKLSPDSYTYLKTGILAHSTSRVKEEPNGIEQRAVRLADKVAYIPQDLGDLLKQGIISFDELTEDEKSLLGLSNEYLDESLPPEEVELTKSIIKGIKNFKNLNPKQREKLSKQMNIKIAEMQEKISEKCFHVNEKGEMELKGFKEEFDKINKVAKGKETSTDNKILNAVPLLDELNKAMKDLDVKRNSVINKNEIKKSQDAVDKATNRLRNYLVDTYKMDPMMATVWITKHKYQDAFISGKLHTRGYRQMEEQDKEKRTLADLNKRNENGWKIKTLFQLYYHNQHHIPSDFLKKYPKDQYTPHQIVSAFIASFTNEGLNNLYNGLVEKGHIVSRDKAKSTLISELGYENSSDIEELLTHREGEGNKEAPLEYVVGYDEEKGKAIKEEISKNDILEYLYETKFHHPIVTGKTQGSMAFSQAKKEAIVEFLKTKGIELNADNPELLTSTIDASKRATNMREIKKVAQEVQKQQEQEEINKRIEEKKEEEARKEEERKKKEEEEKKKKEEESGQMGE